MKIYFTILFINECLELIQYNACRVDGRVSVSKKVLRKFLNGFSLTQLKYYIKC